MDASLPVKTEFTGFVSIPRLPVENEMHRENVLQRITQLCGVILILYDIWVN